MSPNPLSALETKIEQLEQENIKLEKKIKRIEGKSWFEVLITPLTVAAVGFFGSTYLQGVQSNHAKELADAQIAHAQQLASASLEANSLEIFFQYIADESDPTQQKLALRTLRHVPADLALQLSALVAQTSSNPEVKSAAENANQEVQDRPTIARARIIRPSAGMNLRAIPLSDTQLSQTKTVPDSAVGEVICSLPLNHNVEIIEESERWTVVRAQCPNRKEKVVGYISHYNGSPPLEILE